MKLSIITVNLNNRDGLQKTIDSVVAQTFKDFEWIVIDGGSTDGSKELIEQYADHFAYWVSEPDKGIYNAMNKGVKVAKGAYLQFLNSGDWLCDASALERCFRHGFASDIAYGDLYFCDGEDKKKHQYPSKLTLKFLYDYSLGHSASFIRKSLLENDLYNEDFKIVSDWEFFLKQALKNKSFEYINEDVSCFDTSGLSSKNEQLVKLERNRVIKKLVPDMLIGDFELMDQMEAELNGDRVKKVLRFSTRPIYRKVITATLSFIGFIDKVFSKKTK